MQENYLAKWLNGDLTGPELEEFKKSGGYATYRRIRDASERFKAPEFDADRAATALRKKRRPEEGKAVRLHPFRKFLRVAAAVAILITGAYFYIDSLDEHITTSYAENKEITLPDASEVVLNADSELSYSEQKWDETRHVDLKGEAFFKVAKGQQFTVATDAGTVAVLGTRFNVENRKDLFEVTCFEGLVSVSFNEKEIQLSAGRSLLAINGEIVETSRRPNTSAPSWLNNESSFNSVPLRYVLEEFERQHDKEVKTQNIDLDQLFTGTFSNTDTELALKSISVPSQIKFKFEGDKVLFYAENTP
ncbi:MAG TPA: FecR domain-containing protein [Pricia sp.]|nr:FecR domain-containing protein [Pricia sp.]